jgi:hypothetical protein
MMRLLPPALLAHAALAVAAAVEVAPPPIPQAQPARYFTQKTDHFNALSQPTTWQQRYYMDDSAWSGAVRIHVQTTRGNRSQL